MTSLGGTSPKSRTCIPCFTERLPSIKTSLNGTSPTSISWVACLTERRRSIKTSLDGTSPKSRTCLPCFTMRAFNQDISEWNVANVERMDSMFSGASAFNQDISDWNIANVSHMPSMFSGASAFNQDLCAWGSKLQSVRNVQFMFNSTSSCPKTAAPSLIGWAPGPLCHACLFARYPDGFAKCPSGKETTSVAECKEAGLSVGGALRDGIVNVGDWSWAPCGCSIVE